MSEILFNIQSLVLTNRLNKDKPSELLAPLNPPLNWRKESMFRLYAKQRSPVANLTPIAHLEVNLFPLKVHLTEAAFMALHEYFYPRQEVCRHSGLGSFIFSLIHDDVGDSKRFYADAGEGRQ